MNGMVWCVSMSCVAKCTCVLLLLTQCTHAVGGTFRVSVGARFCFSVGINPLMGTGNYSAHRII